MEKLINIGCGQRFHKDWVNVDLNSTGNEVIAYNLLNGIPFGDNVFDVVYHSHILEHFSKNDGEKLLQECYRILKPHGILRIAVPDLEQIVNNYLIQLKKAIEGDDEAASNYEWMILEMYDQTVRNVSGGNMAKYLQQDEIKNINFVINRIGSEGRKIRNEYLSSKNNLAIDKNHKPSLRRFLKFPTYKNKIIRLLLGKEITNLEIGRFRSGGEVHLWMYDRHSLKKLLEQTGFTDISIKNADTSKIHNWNTYHLDTGPNGEIYKPESLYIEAIKSL